MKSFLKTAFLLALLTVLGTVPGNAFGGKNGTITAFILACLMCLGFYWFGGSIVLRTHRAQPLTEEEAPEVFEIVRQLSERAGIPMPRLHLLPSASANALATGRGPKHAVIAVTHGLVGLLNKEELSGVLGHEVSHILSRDILLSSVVSTLAGAFVSIVSLFRGSFFWGGERDERDRENPLPLILFVVVMPMIAALVQLTISRAREYEADRCGARLCEDPLYLASALKKIDAHIRRFPLRDAAPATAHLFIVSPLPAKGWSVLFSTHPSVEDRIARLESQARLAHP